MTRVTVMFTTALALILVTSSAGAQRLVLGGQGAVATGLEAGDRGSGQTTFRRARTRIVAGLSGKVDETPKDGVGVLVFVEVEPHISAGAELRLMHWFSPTFVGFAGGTGAFAPHSLLGGVAGVQIHVPLDSCDTTVFFEPSLSVVPLGTDLPSDHVLIWGLLSAGIHGDF